MELPPTELKRLDDQTLLITWSDGQRKRYAVSDLRKACPCVMCRNERKEAEHAPQQLTILAPTELAPLKIDRMALAEAFAARSPTPQRVLVQVNTGGDGSKAGVDPDQALALCEQGATHPAVSLCGLMTIPPYRQDPVDVAPDFRILAEIQAEAQGRNGRNGCPGPYRAWHHRVFSGENFEEKQYYSKRISEKQLDLVKIFILM